MVEPSSQPRLGRLESLRGAAALYVFVHHYVHVILSDPYPGLARLFKFGQLAVLVFFVVSGFVIFYASAARPFEVRDYLRRRFRRIYPPFVLALLLTWVAQCLIVGGRADPAWPELIGNLLMLQDENVDSWFAPYLANSSLWSLSYEWAFYLLFIPVYAWVPANRQLAVVGAAAAGAFAVHQLVPSQLSLFVMYLPIWWAGVELAREYVVHGAVSLRRQIAPMAVVAGMAALWLIPVLDARASGVELVMWRHPVIELRHFLTAVFILVVAQVWRALRWWGFDATLGPFERIAPISYGLYIVHKPIIHLAAARPLFGNPWAELLWVAPVCFAFAWLVERWIHTYVARALLTRSGAS